MVADTRGRRGQEEERSNQPPGEQIPVEGRRLASYEAVLTMLEEGEIEDCNLIPTGSNYTFSATVSANGSGKLAAIYKPARGERPLWDFPRGTLHHRERAAYLASQLLGWPLIPPTVVRDGPLGAGSVQLFVPTEDRWDFNDLLRKHRRALQEIAVFDLVANNADRKAGHCLLGVDGRVWSIDHGLTFNVDPKLRTVLWDYCGEAVPKRLLGDLEALRDEPAKRDELTRLLEPHLDGDEIAALFRRVERLLRVRKFPQLDDRNIPWPLV